MAPAMIITAKSLRNRIGEALDWVERGDSVTITYRGKPRARLVGIHDPGHGDAAPEEPCAFGMWKDRDDLRDVDEYVRNLRKPRHAG